MPTGACRNQNFARAASPLARLRNAAAALVVKRNGADHQRLIRKANAIGSSIVFIHLTVCCYASRGCTASRLPAARAPPSAAPAATSVG